MVFGVKFWGRCIETLCMLLIPTVIVFCVLSSFFPEIVFSEKVMKAMIDLYGFDPNSFSPNQRIGYFVLNALSTTIFVYGLWLGIKIACLFAVGQVLTASSVMLFVQLRKTSLCWSLYGMASSLFVYLVLMPKMPVAVFMISLGSMVLLYLFMFTFFALLASVVTRGANLQKDQDLTV